METSVSATARRDEVQEFETETASVLSARAALPVIESATVDADFLPEFDSEISPASDQPVAPDQPVKSDQPVEPPVKLRVIPQDADAQSWLTRAWKLRSPTAVSFLCGALVGGICVVGLSSRRPVNPTVEMSSLAGAVAMPDRMSELVHGPLAGGMTTESPRPVQRLVYRGRLRIESAPAGARVFVNNSELGSTPLSLASLPVGSRVVRLEMNGYERWTSAVQVVADQQTRVAARLARASVAAAVP